jgi:hypothetical protein
MDGWINCLDSGRQKFNHGYLLYIYVVYI